MTSVKRYITNQFYNKRISDNKKQILTENTNKLKEVFNAEDNPFDSESTTNFLKKLIPGNPVELNNDLPTKLNITSDAITTLCEHRDSGNHQFATRSCIDLAATTYILHILKTDGLEELKNKLVNFKESFLAYLEANYIEISGINQSHLDIIKFKFGTSFVKLNNFVLDINLGHEVSSDLFSGRSQSYLKNTQIRETFNSNDIKEYKKDAVKYYQTVNEKIRNLQGKTNNEKKAIKKEIIYLNKTLNKSLRKNVPSNIDLNRLNILCENTFKELNITSDKEKLDFINHIIMINYHEHKGLYFKRFLKALALTAGAAAVVSSIVAIALNGVTAFAVVGGVLGVISLIGTSIDVINNTRLSSDTMRGIASKINAGDTLNSYTDSAKIIFQMLMDDEEQIENIETIYSAKDFDRMKNNNKAFWESIPKSKDIKNIQGIKNLNRNLITSQKILNNPNIHFI